MVIRPVEGGLNYFCHRVKFVPLLQEGFFAKQSGKAERGEVVKICLFFNKIINK